MVEHREDPGPWLRRAAHAVADALRSAPRLKTWHVERGLYVSALLGAVWGEHRNTLGLPIPPTGIFAALGLSPVTVGWLAVVMLAVSLMDAVYGAELDSIAARESERAEAEGREAIQVECTPRAALLRRRQPWMSLGLLAYAFGWVGAVGFGWRLGYPLWRRWWRARYPLTKGGA
ncbi:hypothetical protein LXT21_44600 [Myxococcus sp. K38C18041901]|uniref:hypothetical protein n=1 Tax=Myxococcus guangdongensis TaxID=2906760 RepID=UPI0020A6EBE8|nr:hypothetical protein [Myxococcus guangdongensis]MCP3065866.1 hypothetical protein [Myxococcus guangdongensis]